MFLSRNLFFFGILVLAQFCVAQDQLADKELYFSHLLTKDGLSQGSVTSILQDHQGFLWFGTRDGLNRYDGENFEVFRHHSQEIQSLSDSWITALFEDTNHHLWIGTKNGLNVYNPQQATIRRFYKTQNGHGLSHNEIWAIAEQDSTHIWVATSGGLDLLSTNEGKVVQFKHDPKDTNSLSQDHVRALLKTVEGDLWLNTINGVDRYNPNTKVFTHYHYPEKTAPRIRLSNISTLFQDRKRQVWLGFDSGLAYFDKNKGKFLPFRSPTGKSIKTAVRSIYEDEDGFLWVGTYKGLYIIDPDVGELRLYSHLKGKANSLSQNSVYAIVGDAKGDVWIGTWAGGVNHYDRNLGVFERFDAGSGTAHLNYKVVSSILEDDHGDLWVGTEGGGLNFYDASKKRFKYYTNDPNNPNSISDNNIKAMIKDHRGNLWIGTHEGGLNFLDTHKYPLKFKRFKASKGTKNYLKDNRITALLEDANRTLWIGTNEEGLYYFRESTGTFHRFMDQIDGMGTFIYTLSKTHDNNRILVGSEKALVAIDLKQMRATPIPYRGQYADDSMLYRVISTYENEQGNIWVGTEGDGLYFYNTVTQKSVRYGFAQGLPNEVVYAILPDNSGNIWISTNKGLCSIHPSDGIIEVFDESDGVQGGEFNYGVPFKNKDGELFFAGTHGFNKFNPERITKNSFVPPIAITAFRVNNKPYRHWAEPLEEVSLKYDQNAISFDFVALNYAQPEKNQYAYKLEGFDEDWNFVGNRKMATYTNLDWGDYTFRVKAANNHGVWNKIGQAVPLTITPPWWHRWWAYLIYALLVIGALGLIRKYSVQHIRDKSQLKQERLEKQRMKEVNNMKLRLFTNISHDFRTPLTLILGPLESLLQSAHKTDPGFLRQQLSVVHRNAKALLLLVNQLMDFRKNESGKYRVKASEANIVPFIENIQSAFIEMARHRDIRFEMAVKNDPITVWFDEIIVSKVLFNLLSNAFKFTPNGGEVSIEVLKTEPDEAKADPGSVTIKVRDNGRGIPPENIEFIFYRFYQTGLEGMDSGTGIGLALTKNLIELHGGTISADSSLGKGSCFTVTFPLGKLHLTSEQRVAKTPEESSSTLGEASLYIDDTLIDDRLPLAFEHKVDTSMPTLLLVEDNTEIRTFVRKIFLGQYNVLEADNGKEALALIKESSIDLVISDIMMPVMDGLELCHTLKTHVDTSHIPVLLLTARTSVDNEKTGYKTGADGYITKPFNAEVLRIKVGNILKTRQKLTELFSKSVVIEPKRVTVNHADELFLEKAMAIIEEHLSDPDFNVNVFISKLHMSRSVIYRKVKAISGQSIVEFVRSVKLKRAAQLILETDKSISEAAYDTGFFDLKYFRKSFKRQFGKLPSAYRASQVPVRD